MVASIVAIARLGGRSAVVAASALAALSFDYFDSVPYDTWRVVYVRDVVTMVLIVAVGVLVGELTLRMARHRALADRGHRDLAVLTEAAELVAFGRDAGLVIAAIGGELMQLLDLVDCTFHSEAPAGAASWVRRDGTLADSHGAAGVLDLPVWLQGEMFGHYQMVLGRSDVPPQDRLALAVTLADQVGAALAAGETPPPDGPRPGHLRVVREQTGAHAPIELKHGGSRGSTNRAALPPAG